MKPKLVLTSIITFILFSIRLTGQISIQHQTGFGSKEITNNTNDTIPTCYFPGMGLSTGFKFKYSFCNKKMAIYSGIAWFQKGAKVQYYNTLQSKLGIRSKNINYIEIPVGYSYQLYPNIHVIFDYYFAYAIDTTKNTVFSPYYINKPIHFYKNYDTGFGIGVEYQYKKTSINIRYSKSLYPFATNYTAPNTPKSNVEYYHQNFMINLGYRIFEKTKK